MRIHLSLDYPAAVIAGGSLVPGHCGFVSFQFRLDDLPFIEQKQFLRFNSNTSARIPGIMPSPIADLLSRPIPEKLWHYTSIRGFEGIVTSKSIFATDLHYLNDREEFIHSQDIANRLASAAPALDENGLPDRSFLEKAVSLAFDSGPITRTEVFIACFSAAEDQLGQWRGYSQGATGVSLGFDLKALRPPAGIDTLVSFAPCVYESSRKEELMLDALHHFKKEVGGYWEKTFRTATDVEPEKTKVRKEQVVREFLEANPGQKASVVEFQKAVTNMRADCLRIAALLKNVSFEEEQEWRFVLPVMMDRSTPLKNPPRFRVGKTTLIPYIAYPFQNLPLTDVILGPGSDENSRFAADRFLKSQGLNITPRFSKVPYRAT